MNAPIATQTMTRSTTRGGPATTGTCLPHELPDVLARYAGLKVLSLDCFDTLLWRDCHSPKDLFAVLPGLNPMQRVHGELRARQSAHAARGIQDVSIDEIYRAIMPGAAEGERARAIAAEIDAEARHCYAFAPTVALMREARRQGLQIILVSDTYLNPAQLRDLVARAAGTDVAALIDRIFCSSTYGKPKAAGLYQDVLLRLRVRPEQILHIGDNEAADVGGVHPFGVHTLHLQQFDAGVQQQLRLESAVAALIHGHGRTDLLTPQPHRPALALHARHIADPAQRFGFMTLGPVFTAFNAWLQDEARRLAEQRGGTVHWLFMMRDGHLPMRVHAVTSPGDAAHPIEISRLTATFASFAADAAIVRHLDENLEIDAAVLARQLRLPDEITKAVIADRPEPAARRALQAWCRNPANRRGIVRAAQALAERLVEHVRTTVQPAPGDTLMLVDLGYNGTVQSLIDGLLRRELGVHVAGRYLILREVQVSGLDKAGLIDPAHFDFSLLNAMTANVALIEQLATTAQGSVIDYAADGTPQRGANEIGKRQSDVREAVQEGVLAFARDGDNASIRTATHEPIALWRNACAATLMRLMYLPTVEELAVVTAFEHDVNLGTGETLALFDPAHARKGLLQQGLFYQKGVRRMFLPAELAGENLATRLTHLATARFHMPFTAEDFAGGNRTVPVIYSDTRGATRLELPTRPTHDGYEALCIPVGDGRFTVGVQFAALASHVEVESIVALPAKEYLDARHDSHAREFAIEADLNGITALTPRLWDCSDAAGFAFLQAPVGRFDGDILIVVVFRLVG